MAVKMLRVTGWGSNSYWYAGKAGQVFCLLATDLAAGEYITREPSGHVNIIKCADAEVVDVVPSVPTCAAQADASPPSAYSPYRMVFELAPINSATLSPLDAHDIAERMKKFVDRFLSVSRIDARVTLS